MFVLDLPPIRLRSGMNLSVTLLSDAMHSENFCGLIDVKRLDGFDGRKPNHATLDGR